MKYHTAVYVHPFTLRMSKEVKVKAAKISKKKDMSVNEMINTIILEYPL